MSSTPLAPVVAPLQLSNTFRILKSWAQNEKIALDSIKRDLTVTDPDTKQESHLFFENDEFLYVPRYYGLSKWYKQKELVILLQKGKSIPDDNCVFSASLIEDGKKQMTATKTAMAKMFDRKSFGCVLRMPCGFGKTVCALYLVSQYRRKTIYIVQADHLSEQTIQSIGRFMPKICVGQMRGPPKSWVIENCDIVVAMMQTLYVHRNELKSNLTLSFGFGIVDECHHIGAPTFCAVLQRFASAWILGLTATPSRMDHKTKWIQWMLGPIVDVFESAESKRPDISVVWSQPLPSSFPPNHLSFVLQEMKANQKQKQNSTLLLNLVQWDVNRRNAQIDHLMSTVFSSLNCHDPFRPQVVLFAPRVFQLCLVSYALQRRYVRKRVQDICMSFSFLPPFLINTISQFVFYHEPMETCINSEFANQIISVSSYYSLYGKNKTLQDEMKEYQSSYFQYVNSLLPDDPFLFPMRILHTKTKKQFLDRTVLFATIRKLGEGTDVDSLHTVGLLHSISSKNMGQFEQVVGRLRKKSGIKKKIIEFRDQPQNCLFQRQGYKRSEYYKSRSMPQDFI